MSYSEQCFECGEANNIQHHHVIPRSRGGKKTVPLCEKCHGLVHNKSMDIGDLIRETMSQKRKQNLRISGYIPYGYDTSSDKKTLIENEKEQAIIGKMIKMRNNKKSFWKIANYLNRRCIETRTKTLWSATVVRGIICRKLRYEV